MKPECHPLNSDAVWADMWLLLTGNDEIHKESMELHGEDNCFKLRS
jgi:hypothetical protein